MNTRSITFRLAAWYAGVSLMVCVGFGLYTYLGLHYYLTLSQTDNLYRRARQVAAIVATHIPREGEAFAIGLLQTSYAPEQNDRFIRIRRPDGAVLYASGAPSDHSFDPAVVPILPLPVNPSSRASITLGNLLLVQTSARVRGEDYLIDCGASKLPGIGVQRGFLALLAFGLPLVLVVAIGGGVVLVRRALGPVREIIEAAREMTSYNLGRRLPVVRTNDELELLSVVLNQMIGRLDKAFEHSRRFTADASHELRTPLTIMRVELESVSQEHALGVHVREKIASVLEETERLARTVEGLFAISRLEAGEALMEVTRFDLAELTASTAEQMALLADEKRLQLQVLVEDPVFVAGDRFRLKQVIVNLLDNAIKYSPDQGKVVLDVHAVDGEAILEVRDQGPGIPPEALPQVFDRFFRADTVRTHHAENGAGLGLSIVRSICLAHGGTVEAANEPGGGCRITVRVPLGVRPASSATQHRAPVVAAAGTDSSRSTPATLTNLTPSSS